MGRGRLGACAQVLPTHARRAQPGGADGPRVGTLLRQPEGVAVQNPEGERRMTAASATTQLDRYLARVRVAMRGLPDREIDDVLHELRSHVDDMGAEGVDAALDSLGDPLALAQRYRSDNEMVRAECSGSPLAILGGLRHASPASMGR